MLILSIITLICLIMLSRAASPTLSTRDGNSGGSATFNPSISLISSSFVSSISVNICAADSKNPPSSALVLSETQPLRSWNATVSAVRGFCWFCFPRILFSHFTAMPACPIVSMVSVMSFLYYRYAAEDLATCSGEGVAGTT